MDEYHNRTIQSQYSRIDTDENPNIYEIADELQKLREKVAFLEKKRITQVDIVPYAIKQRHVGEGVKFIQSGLDTDKPTGETPLQGSEAYFATDTNKLYIFNGTAWVSTTLT